MRFPQDFGCRHLARREYQRPFGTTLTRSKLREPATSRLMRMNGAGSNDSVPRFFDGRGEVGDRHASLVEVNRDLAVRQRHLDITNAGEAVEHFCHFARDELTASPRCCPIVLRATRVGVSRNLCDLIAGISFIENINRIPSRQLTKSSSMVTHSWSIPYGNPSRRSVRWDPMNGTQVQALEASRRENPLAPGRGRCRGTGAPVATAIRSDNFRSSARSVPD